MSYTPSQGEDQTLEQKLQSRLAQNLNTNSDMELAIAWLQKNPEFEFVLKMMRGMF